MAEKREGNAERALCRSSSCRVWCRSSACCEVPNLTEANPGEAPAGIAGGATTAQDAPAGIAGGATTAEAGTTAGGASAAQTTNAISARKTGDAS